MASISFAFNWLSTLAAVAVAGLAAANESPTQKFVEPIGPQRPIPIANRPFDMVDDAGRPLKSNDVIELSNGRTVTARDFYDSLNRIEVGLNKVGHSLRETGTRRIEGANYADAKVIQSQFDAYARLSTTVSQLALANRKAIFHAPKSTALTVVPTSASQAKFGTASTSELAKVMDQGTSIGNNATTIVPWGMEKSFGDSNLGVKLSASVALNASSVNSANPPTLSGSTTTISAIFTGGCQGTLLGNQFNILNASCQVGTSSKAKNVNLGWNVNVAGFEILTGTKSYGASLQWSDGYSIPFQQQSQTMEFPIFGPFACSGFVGVQGEAGINANIVANPIYAEADLVPFVKASVYGEVDAGLEAEIASAWGGLHADFTLVDEQFTLGANIGIVALPENQIGWSDVVYVHNSVSLFNGSLSLVAHVFGPGGVRLQDWEYPFYTVTGFHKDGNLFNSGAVHPLNWGSK